jgi:hypothetical protein
MEADDGLGQSDLLGIREAIMPFKKGQSGNPGGRVNDKPFAEALRIVMAEEDPVRKKRRLRVLAEKTYDEAMAGQGWAVQTIADRLDGKPTQESTLNVIRARANELSDDELADIAAGSSEGTAERRSIRRSLTEWCQYAGFEPARHHRLLIEALEAVARGELPLLAIFMPPGSAKSTYGSVLFPPWYMQLTGGSVIAASHTVELAEKWGRRIRGLVNEHTQQLGIELASDSQAAGRWALTSGAEYYAAGVGTGMVCAVSAAASTGRKTGEWLWTDDGDYFKVSAEWLKPYVRWRLWRQ